MTDAEVVRELFAAFARRDADAAARWIAPDADFWAQGTGERVGRDGPYRGPDGLREYFADVERTWEELEIETGNLRTVPGAVVAFGTARGVTGGRRVEAPVIWMFRLRDGVVFHGRATRTAQEAEDLAEHAQDAE